MHEAPADSSALRNVSDTALWVAIYRADESERHDAHFHDPYARRLAGERGAQIMRELHNRMSQDWPFTSRTVSIDAVVMERVTAGADMVINLACGLDARPYRLELPADLRWVEVDMDEMIDHKEEVLDGEQPRCHLERIRLDLRDADARRQLFGRLNSECTNALVITEGLLIYLSEDEVSELARDLAAEPHFRDWTTDVGTPALLKMLQKSYTALDKANAPLRFAHDEGPDFYKRFGWEPVEIYSALHTANKLKRLPFYLKLFAMFPDTEGRKPKQVWGGVVRLKRIAGTGV